MGSGLITRYRTDQADSGLTKMYAIEDPGEWTYLLNESPQTVSGAHAALEQACLCRFGRCIDHSPIPPHPTRATPRHAPSTHPTARRTETKQASTNNRAAPRPNPHAPHPATHTPNTPTHITTPRLNDRHAALIITHHSTRAPQHRTPRRTRQKATTR